MIRLALVGAAHIHTPGIVKQVAEREDFEFAQVWDNDAERAKKWANETGGKAITDLDDLDTDLDGFAIFSETNKHEELVEALARHGKPIFIEKPLGMATGDARKIARLLEENGVLFSTGYFMRGNPHFLFLKNQVEEGTFGKITRVRASKCHPGALQGWFDGEWRWMADPDQAGVGAFGDLGTHVLDILLWMFGEVTEVAAYTSEGTNRYDGCDETGEGLLRFRNGAIGTLAAGWLDIANPVTFLISGTQGHAVIFNGELYFQSENVEGADGKQPWTDLPEARVAGFPGWVDAVTGKGEASLVTPEEAAYRSIVTDMLYTVV
jgi:predicted dehydrogenase